MATITKITTQKRRGRFNIYIDRGNGEEFGFGVSDDILVSFGLTKGQEIDQNQLQEIIFNDEVQKAFNLSVNFLSYRMRSIKEIVDHLNRKDVPSEVVEQVISNLEEKRYVDDLEFAKTYVRSKKNTSAKGPAALSKELKQKGIMENDLETALLEYPFEAQVKAAISFASKKAKQQTNKSSTETKLNLAQTLAGKGFSWDVVEAALDEAEIDKDEDKEWEALKKQGEKAHRKYSKYNGWEYENRMKQHLHRKGFHIQIIDQFIEEMRSL
jgi:regulatory protein